MTRLALSATVEINFLIYPFQGKMMGTIISSQGGVPDPGLIYLPPSEEDL